jgi:hypothetical protein
MAATAWWWPDQGGESHDRGSHGNDRNGSVDGRERRNVGEVRLTRPYAPAREPSANRALIEMTSEYLSAFQPYPQNSTLGPPGAHAG